MGYYSETPDALDRLRHQGDLELIHGPSTVLRPPVPPLFKNVATFAKPAEYSKQLSKIKESGPPRATASQPPRPRRRNQPSAIDRAIQNEYFGDGLALEPLVERRRQKGWAVQQRQAQKCDVGHCCHACKRPFRDLNEEMIVWTGAAIYNRFHSTCAATYVLRSQQREQLEARDSEGDGSRLAERYADGWRQPSDRPTRQAARQWLLSQDPGAWVPLRGDIFTTVTMVGPDGQKKAVPGLSAAGLSALRLRCRLGPAEEQDPQCGQCELQCSICFENAPSTAEEFETSKLWLQLPCSPQHVFHAACVQPWLRKASLCPVCRTDIRPLLALAGFKGDPKAGCCSPEKNQDSPGKHVEIVEVVEECCEPCAPLPTEGILVEETQPASASSPKPTTVATSKPPVLISDKPPAMPAPKAIGKISVSAAGSATKRSASSTPRMDR